MAKQFKADDLFVELGAASSRTASAGSLIATAVPEDGFQVGGSRSSTDLPTDHGAAGVLLSYEATRNAEAGSASWYPFPLNVGTIFTACAGAETDNFVELRWHKGNANLSSSDINGQEMLGGIFDGFTLNIDRSGESQPLTLDTSIYVNRVDNRIQGTDTVPTKPAHTILPYQSGGVLVDVKHNAADTFGGDHPEILGVNVSYTRGAELAGFASSSTANLNNTWTRVDGYDLGLTVELTVNLDGYDWPLDIINASERPIGAMRLALTHPNADTTTTTEDIAAGVTGSAQTIAMADASEFLAGDVCILRDFDNDRFGALTIDSIATNDVDFDTTSGNYTLDLAIEGSGSTAAGVENMGVFLDIPRMQLAGHGRVVRNGRKRSITLTYNASLNVGESNLLTALAYNHPESRL